MKLIGVNPETGDEFQTESTSISSDFLKLLADFEMSEEGVKRLIDGLDISADAKLLLLKFSKATITAGEYVVKLGRKIIDIVCTIYKAFPETSFQVIFWSIVGFLVSTIPIIGAVLGPVFTPILIAFGVYNGLMADVENETLKKTVSQIATLFSPLMA
jgi:hypothetical protein